MFNLGWSEILVVAVIAIIVVGPNEMPRILRGFMGVVRKIKTMASEFQHSMEDIANESDIEDIKNSISQSTDELDIKIDPSEYLSQMTKKQKKEFGIDAFEREIVSSKKGLESVNILKNKKTNKTKKNTKKNTTKLETKKQQTL